jgi:hypothetical protein
VTERMLESLVQVQQKQKMDTSTTVTRIAAFTFPKAFQTADTQYAREGEGLHLSPVPEALKRTGHSVLLAKDVLCQALL